MKFRTMLGLGWGIVGCCLIPAPGYGVVPQGVADPANDWLIADPVASPVPEAAQTPASSPREKDYPLYTPETLPPGDPYPISTPAAAPTPMMPPAAGSAAPKPMKQFPAFLTSAFVPELDRTEVDLDLLINGSPGIQAYIGWGAMENTLMAAQMTVQGASYNTGIRYRYNFRQEAEAESKPAMAVDASWRYANHRTQGEVKKNIFRGNRFQAGVVFSKSLGSLTRGLGVKTVFQEMWDAMAVHLEPLLEVQSGRAHEDEQAVTGLEVGFRAALEMILNPKLTLYLNYDSQPNWLGVEDYFIGARFLPQEDFALEGLLGRIYNQATLQLGVSWIF